MDVHPPNIARLVLNGFDTSPYNSPSILIHYKSFIIFHPSWNFMAFPGSRSPPILEKRSAIRETTRLQLFPRSESETLQQLVEAARLGPFLLGDAWRYPKDSKRIWETHYIHKLNIYIYIYIYIHTMCKSLDRYRSIVSWKEQRNSTFPWPYNSRLGCWPLRVTELDAGMIQNIHSCARVQPPKT